MDLSLMRCRRNFNARPPPVLVARNNNSISPLALRTPLTWMAAAFLGLALSASGAGDPAREKQLRDALAMFDGDWAGDVFLWNADGTLMRTTPARRHHRWVGDVQIVVTAFDLGPDTISMRMRRWIEEGVLKAVVHWPVSPPESFRGQVTSDGIAWFNEATGYRTLADRMIREDGVRKLEATTVETTLLTTDSEQVGIDAVFERMRNSSAESSPPLELVREEAPGEAARQEQDEAASTGMPDRSVPVAIEAPPEADVPEVPQPPASDSGRPTGSVYLSSDPPYVSFTLRPADADAAEGIEPRTGTTPLLVEDLPSGTYTATFQRAGWPVQTSRFEIVAGQATSLSHQFEGGSVEISSQPAGARIMAGDRFIGLTPLTVRNIPPGPVRYVINRPGFHPVETQGAVRANESLALRVNLEADGSTVEVGDLEVRPIPTRQVSPDVRRGTVPAGSRAVVELTVDRRGRAQDAHLVSTTDEAFGQLCLRAAARWRFEPGRVGEVAVPTRVKIPFVAN